MPWAKLLDAVTTTGAGTVKQWFGGQGTISANGFGGSGSVKLQHSPASSTGPFVDSSTEAVLSASSTAGSFNFSLGQCWIRPLVTVASSTGINYWVH